MKIIKVSLAAAVMVTGLAADVKVSGDATFTSNALWRGTSLTSNTPTVQTTLSAEFENGAYAGIWGTGLSAGSEFDLFVGYATEVSGIGVDAGFVAYTSTNPTKEEFVLDEYGEIYVGLSKSVMDIDLGATLYKGVLSEDSDSTIIEVSADKDFDVAYVGAAAGYQVDDESGANYYSLSVGKAVESLNGDVSFTFANTTADDAEAVYSLTYTTSF